MLWKMGEQKCLTFFTLSLALHDSQILDIMEYYETKEAELEARDAEMVCGFRIFGSVVLKEV